VGVLQIIDGDPQIPADGIQGAVSEHGGKNHGVGSTAKHVRCECAPEGVGTDMLDACFLFELGE